MPIYSSLLRRNTIRSVVSGAVALSLLTGVAKGQSESSAAGARGGIPAGFELDNYVRFLQSMGRVPLGAWGLRPFSAPEVDSLTKRTRPHPWANSWIFRSGKPRHYSLLPVSATVGYNSAFPWGSNDGAVWAGRGVTTSVQGGVAAAWGPVTLVLNPILFRAENTSFTLVPNTETGSGRFANGSHPNNVDLPQRFGDGAYSKFDWGQSTLRVDWLGVTFGVSTANQYWGPATVFPVILGNNAAGIPHAFFGTQRPTDILIGRFQARVVYGLEGQSAYSPVQGSVTFRDVATYPGTRRFMSGLVGTFSPSPIPGLEIGAARFFHRPWTGQVTSTDLRSPFDGLLGNASAPVVSNSASSDGGTADNQLASLFGRWVLPHSGFEMYFEYGHEDHNANVRDLAGEPDHSRIAMVGFRKVFVRTDNAFSALTAEYIDGSDPTLARNRGESSVYVHTVLRQGHTEDGQLLGADIGVGSPAGGYVAWQNYSPAGVTKWYLNRTVQNNQAPLLTYGIPSSAADQLFVTVGYERRRFGQRADLTYGLSVTEGKRGTTMPRETNIGASVGVLAHLP